jgi:putative transposase
MVDKWLTAGEIAGVLSIKKRPLNVRAKREGWPYRAYAVRGGQERRYPLAKLPEDIQAAYAASIKTGLEELRRQLQPVSKPEKKIDIRYSCRSGEKTPVKNMDHCTEEERNIARLRLKIIEAYDASGFNVPRFIEAYEKGAIVPDIKERLGRWGLIHTPHVFYDNWLRRYALYGLAGLAPQYRRNRGGAGASLPQDVKDRIEWLYLDSGKPSIRTVRENLKQYGMEADYATVRRYVRRIPAPVVIKNRNGEKCYHDKCELYKDRDYTQYRSMDTICGDYMTEDIACRVGTKVFRARLCAFEDMRSRAIVGWSLQTTANSVGVVRSLKMAFERHGLPETVYVDNGKEFKNYWLCGDEWKSQRTKIDPDLLDLDAGILKECGVKIVFCKPYSGQSKPIERFWRTFHERFDKFVATYLGSNTNDRPDDVTIYMGNLEKLRKEDIDAIPTFEKLEELIGHFVEWYNAEWHHSGQGMEGNVPNQVLRENAAPRRDLPEELKKYVFTQRYIKVVQRKGVGLDGIWYYAKELAARIGEKVEVRRGLDNSGKVHIFSLPDRVYLFDAENLAWTGVLQEDLEKLNKLRKEARALHKQYNKKKEEYDRGIFRTPAEIYAEEERKAAGGEDMAAPASAGPALVTPEPKPRRKIESLFGEKL